MQARRSVAFALLCGIALVSNSCTLQSDGETTSAPATTTIPTVPEAEGNEALTIGLLVPTTGDGAGIGDTITQAVQNEIMTINRAGGVLGNTVRLRIEDESTHAGFVSLLTGAGDPVDAIVGPTSSLVALRELDMTVEPPSQIVTCSPAATAISLDKFSDGGWFFRTIPSDSLLMKAIVKRARATGQSKVAIAYVDDPYGRSLAAQLRTDIAQSAGLSLTGTEVPVPADRDIAPADVDQILEGDPGVIIILADAVVGGRLLTALDGRESTSSFTRVLVNDTVRTATLAIAGLSESMRKKVRAIAPKTAFKKGDVEYPPFAAQAIDCVDLIALAAVEAESDQRIDIKRNLSSISQGGQACQTFETCAKLLLQGRFIDYVGRSGPVDLSETGDPNRATFQELSFDADGFETPNPEEDDASG